MLHHLTITLLAAFRPDILFTRLYELPWYRGLLEGWATDMELEPGQKILEVGCGSGALTHSLKQRGLNITGVDRSARMVEAARRRGGYNGARILQADATALPFADQQFSRIIAASLINVVPEITPVLSEMRRVLQPGGRIGLLFPCARMTPAGARTYAHKQGLRGFSAAALEAWATKAPKGDLPKIQQGLRAAGFSDLRHRPYLADMVVTLSARA